MKINKMPEFDDICQKMFTHFLGGCLPPPPLLRLFVHLPLNKARLLNRLQRLIIIERALQ